MTMQSTSVTLSSFTCAASLVQGQLGKINMVLVKIVALACAVIVGEMSSTVVEAANES